MSVYLAVTTYSLGNPGSCIACFAESSMYFNFWLGAIMRMGTDPSNKLFSATSPSAVSFSPVPSNAGVT